MNLAAIFASGLLAAAACVSFAQPEAAQPASDDPALRPADYQPAADYYDWRKTGRPERPWFHEYDQSLVMKIFLAGKSNAAEAQRKWRRPVAAGFACAYAQPNHMVDWVHCIPRHAEMRDRRSVHRDGDVSYFAGVTTGRARGVLEGHS